MKEAVKKRNFHVESLSDNPIKVVAVMDGQHDGVIKKQGVEFHYKGNLINGNFPRWVECLDEKFESKFSKLGEEEKKVYLKKESNKDSANVDIEKIKSEMKAELEAEVSEELREKIRAEVAQEMISSSGDEQEPASHQEESEGHVLHEPSHNSIV